MMAGWSVQVLAEDNDADEARAALQQQEGDATEESNLEEVFQASERQYSLLRSGGMALNFSGDYSYFRNDRIDIAIGDNGGISRFRIENDAEHSFGASLSFDYGIWNNLTFNTRLPVQYKYDTEKDAQKASLGDITFGLRYQPFPVRPGGINTTLFTTLSTATGDSPYTIDARNDVSSGKGYYSLGGGVSMSKVVDPVVLFGSVGYTMAFDATGLDQQRGKETLRRVEPGDSLSFSMGLAYALSYEVSVSASYQQSYNFVSHFRFEDEDGIGYTAKSEDSTSSILNTSLGLRTSSNRIINISFGFGLTEDSPDVLLGISLPIDISGLKPGA
ncbi:transporter [Alcanivorax sp. JB21]|nr:transporter [Alcanivorax limicola]